ncbi:Sec61p translocation complex subunit [Geranomyces variabilis]|uniref:Sec61p translocation complex subunit n=1 Tax=Geranomyces variabilis TaxID=109894 RepID=A0AAD5XN94_9FUNG|nr:Sec61p translocation complex subunit [Geranomyces variabilis]
MSDSPSSSGTNNTLVDLIDGPRQFMKDGVQLMTRCAKPDRKEFIQVTQAVSIGFLIMGFIGFFVKLVHIPINNIIVGRS